MLMIYGIKNCDTMKKAFAWLDEQSLEYQFHNYKKDGVTKVLLNDWVSCVGWQVLVNKRGTTWRKLSDKDKSDIDDEKAIVLMQQNPALIKRPVLADSTTDEIIVGFSKETYQQCLLTAPP